MEQKKKRMMNVVGKRLEEKFIMEKIIFYMRQNKNRVLDLMHEALVHAMK